MTQMPFSQQSQSKTIETRSVVLPASATRKNHLLASFLATVKLRWVGAFLLLCWTSHISTVLSNCLLLPSLYLFIAHNLVYSSISRVIIVLNIMFAVYIQAQSTNGIPVAAAAAADVEAVCEQNLLRHITRLQDGIDDRLAMIEKQVTGILPALFSLPAH